MDRTTTITYVDALGNLMLYDGVSPVSWRVSSYVLAMQKGKVLLVDHPWAKRWELPGGEVDPNESLVQGAIRECWEETGYRFRATNTMPSFMREQFFYRRGKKTFHHSLIVVFEGVVEGEIDPNWQQNSGEISEVAWTEPAVLTPATTYAFHWPALEYFGLVC